MGEDALFEIFAFAYVERGGVLVVEYIDAWAFGERVGICFEMEGERWVFAYAVDGLGEGFWWEVGLDFLVELVDNFGVVERAVSLGIGETETLYEGGEIVMGVLGVECAG